MDIKGLKVNKRKIVGRKVKKLRKDGILPANIYGKKIESLAIELPVEEFAKVYEEVGETGVVGLIVDSEEKTRNVLVHNVHRDPVSDEFLHVDFHQVVLTEKMTANVPIEVEGEAPAVKENLGVLLTPLSEVEVEALPTDFPESIKVDVSTLAELNAEIQVSDLAVGVKVKILADGGMVVCKIGALTKEEEEKPVEKEVEGEEKPEEAVKEGEEKPKEGEERSEEGEKEEEIKKQVTKKEFVGKKEKEKK